MGAGNSSPSRAVSPARSFDSRSPSLREIRVLAAKGGWGLKEAHLRGTPNGKRQVGEGKASLIHTISHPLLLFRAITVKMSVSRHWLALPLEKFG